MLHHKCLPIIHFLGTISYTPKSAKRYQQAIIEKFPPLFLKIKHLVIDCAHGAFSDIAPAVFQALELPLL